MPNLSPDTLATFVADFKLPALESHKGQNGKALVIGGSELFHAASKWSLDTVSRLVDMVFYVSVPSNNSLVQEAKGAFWNGLIITRPQLESYIQEADVVLIGPGMERSEFEPALAHLTPSQWAEMQLTEAEWNSDTEKITNMLLAKYPDKKWVIDAGALQMIHPELLTDTCVLTPHHGELERLKSRTSWEDLMAKKVTLLVKGETDQVQQGPDSFEIKGGNPGMTKGGTGDVLAGLVAGLYATQSALAASVIGSYVNKKAGEILAEKVGPFFNASDLAAKVPEVLWQTISEYQQR